MCSRRRLRSLRSRSRPTVRRYPWWPHCPHSSGSPISRCSATCIGAWATKILPSAPGRRPAPLQAHQARARAGRGLPRVSRPRRRATGCHSAPQRWPRERPAGRLRPVRHGHVEVRGQGSISASSTAAPTSPATPAGSRHGRAATTCARVSSARTRPGWMPVAGTSTGCRAPVSATT